MTLTAFAPIAPSPVRDYRSFDFAREIGTGSLGPPVPGVVAAPAALPSMAAICEAVWSCEVAGDSPQPDDAPARCLIAAPVFTATATSQLVGDCVQGVTYRLNVRVTLTDGRVLVKDAVLPCYGASDDPPPLVLPNGAIPFDYEGWIVKFPEFAMLTEAQAQAYWDEAGLLFRNNFTSPEQNIDNRREILDLLTAHCAALFAPAPIGRGGSAGTGAMMGVITSKSVNGVSVGSSGLLPGFSGIRAWFAQTQYGLKYLALTAGWRQFHYVPGPLPRFPPSYWPYQTWPRGMRGPRT